MGVVDKFGLPKPISSVLNWARSEDSCNRCQNKHKYNAHC